MLHMKFPPTTQQLEEAGFDKGQAEIIAGGFAITDQRHGDIMTLLQSILSEVRQGHAETNKKVDAANQRLVDFQLQTERRFSDTKVFVVLWTAGIVIVAAGGMYAAVRDLLVNVLSLGVG